MGPIQGGVGERKIRQIPWHVICVHQNRRGLLRPDIVSLAVVCQPIEYFALRFKVPRNGDT